MSEEDKKVLKQFYKYIKPSEEFGFVTNIKLNQAIENLLNELSEKSEQVKMLDEAYSGAIKESKKWFDIAKDSVPKEEIREKIEDIEDYFDRLNVPDEDIKFIREKRKEILGE